jgi:uncharacterized protein YndB with AHSA1/START domain
MNQINQMNQMNQINRMEQKTKIHAEDNKQELLITREFDLPVELLFKAYTEPELLEQWMGTKVLELESKKHGTWHFETTDPNGNKHGFSGVIHEFSPSQKITRTFEMENTSFPVQLEFLEFEKRTDHTSKLSMHIVFKSIADRDQMLKLPFTNFLSMAHNRLEKLFTT